MSQPVFAETLRCKIRDNSTIGDAGIAEEAVVKISGSKATYTDKYTLHFFGKGIDATNHKNQSRIEFKYSAVLPLEGGQTAKMQWYITYIKSTKILAINTVLSGYDNDNKGMGKCR